MNWRRIARPVVLVVVLTVKQLTTVFAQFPLLRAIAVAGVAVVMLDAMVCAVRRWRSIQSELG